MFFKRKLKKYYREYTACWGWGVGLTYDTVEAYSKNEAINKPMWSRYGITNAKALEYIIKIPKEHIHLSKDELSEIYGKNN